MICLRWGHYNQKLGSYPSRWKIFSMLDCNPIFQSLLRTSISIYKVSILSHWICSVIINLFLFPRNIAVGFPGNSCNIGPNESLYKAMICLSWGHNNQRLDPHPIIWKITSMLDCNPISYVRFDWSLLRTSTCI